MLERWVRRRVVITWVASYVLISLIPLAGGLITHRITADVLRRETSAANRYMLAALRRQCDAVIGDVTRVFNDVAQSPNLVAALSTRPVIARAYDLLLLVREIRASLLASGTRVEEAFLISGSPPLVVSGRGHFPPELYRDTYFRPEFGTVGLWDTLISPGAGDLERGSDLDPDLILVRRDLPLSGGSVRARFVAVVRLDALRTGPDGEPLTGVLSVVAGNGNVLWSSSPMEPGGTNGEAALMAAAGETAGSYVVVREGKRVVVTVLPSAYLGVRYAASVDEALLQRNATAVARAAIVAFVLSAVLCTLVVAMALRSNYRPLRRLLMWIERREPEARVEPGDEYDRLLHSVERVYHRIERSETVLEAQREALRQALVVQVLHGWAGDDAVDRFRALGVLFPHPRFAVLALSLDHDPDVPVSAVTPARAHLQGILREQDPRMGCVLAEIRGMAVCVLNPAADLDLGQVTALAEGMRRALARAAATDCDAGLSAVHDSLPALFRAWTEALEALEHCRRKSHDALAVYGDLERPQRTSYHFPLEAEIRLTEAVKRGDSVVARSVADEAFRRGTDGATPPVPRADLAWVLALDITSAAIRSVGIAEDDADGALRSLTAAVERLGQDTPPEVLGQEVAAIVEQAAAAALLRRGQNGVGGKAAALVERVRSYLEQHHTDSSLNPDSVADALGAHPVTVARAFRSVTGLGMAEYLTHLRVERAKPLLRNGPRSIEEVARCVGFANTKTMTRAFKRIEGITPGRFKGIGAA